MKCFSVFAAAITLVCAASVSSVQADGASPDGGKNWSYKTNDPSVFSPSEWSHKYPACGGQRQSPINIVPKQLCGDDTQKQEREKQPLVLSGECSKYKVKQYYDAFKAEAVDSTCQVSANGKPYKYLQAHFHAPAEHTINGKVHDAEIHYVHKADDGLLVIGLFFEKKADAKTDPFVLQFWQQMKNVNANATASATMDSFFPTLESSMRAGRLFNYPGSLTSPTCNETVDWWVVEKPLKVSAHDFGLLEHELKRIEASDNGKAARPTQPLNGRIVKVY